MVGVMLGKAADKVVFEPVTHFPGQTDLLEWCQTMGPGTGILLVLLGAAHLLYGWSLYKVLVTLNAAVVGGYIGAWIGMKAGATVAGGIVGAVTSAAICYPLMKWSVAGVGGIVGAMLGASVWRTFNLDPNYAWAGAMTGLVGFGLLSFILFRGSIIMYTSFEGAGLVIAGALGLAFKYQDLGGKVAASISSQPMALPAALLLASFAGLVFQQLRSAPAGVGGDGDRKK